MSFNFRTPPSPAHLILPLILMGIGLLSASEHLNHQVQPGESLFALALRYECSVEELKTLNSLNRDVLYSGEELKIPLKYPDSHKVQSGETLSGIALKYGIPQEKLISLNRLNGTNLNSLKELELIRPPLEGEVWTVRKGDSLSWLSLKFNISLERLMQINLLDSSGLKEGQLLELTPPRPQVITLEKGDSLWKISTLYNVELSELMRWNQLESDRVFEGMQLQMYSVVLNLEEEDKKERSEEKKGFPADPEILMAQVELTPSLYYSTPTERKTQPDRNYSETDLDDPMNNYLQASRLLEDFEQASRALPPLSRKLRDFTVIIDPGHGGLDPGAIVASSDGNGNTVYVVEDEYCYDISLRVYRDLIRHGADVVLTVISPNQVIRTTEDASLTFVNEKNEVYNDSKVNRFVDAWPVGNAWGLDQRKEVARLALRESPGNKSVFISIHADNNTGDGKGTRVLFHPDEKDTSSEDLARQIQGFMGADSLSRAQELRVLEANPADAAVLVEVRNLAFKSNAWAIRNEELRQDDADRIVKGIVSYFK
ncbi:LysM peptidoglycan-binding domain-containing protein [Oceanispirochaeta sp.]|jgi:LysM repeat protein/N-acetylmuramoyl-L-alanine amidase|uniref:LysM peptidoglycan-binding domain-containing protein n=1 Tax=Oceanispirochaeta sp. TaxID=2035350 RepID=UPI00262A5035|nr:LysM peptidoglycan-binding domain-containing protein [Oceanispirochaeta sp.]MDA3956191.1 LysM peptidoglycan-binding domain-containing protein [Oceanispirochaeta sp.]